VLDSDGELECVVSQVRKSGPGAPREVLHLDPCYPTHRERTAMNGYPDFWDRKIEKLKGPLLVGRPRFSFYGRFEFL